MTTDECLKSSREVHVPPGSSTTGTQTQLEFLYHQRLYCKNTVLEPLKHVVEGGHVHDRLSVVAGIESVVHERRERVAGVEVHAARVRGYGSVRGQSVHAGAVVRVGAGVAGAAHAAAHVAGVHLLGGGGVVEAEPRHAAPALLLDVVAAPLRAGVLEPHLVGKEGGG